MVQQQTPFVLVVLTIIIQEVFRYLLSAGLAQTPAPTPEPYNASVEALVLEEPTWYWWFIVLSAGALGVAVIWCCCFCDCEREEQSIERVQLRGLRLRRNDGAH